MLLLFAAFSLAISGLSPISSNCSTSNPNACLCGYIPKPHGTQVPFVVTVGFYILQLTALNIDSNQIGIRGYCWLKWDAAITESGEEFRPDVTLEFVNIFTFVDFTLTGLFGGAVSATAHSTRSLKKNANLAKNTIARQHTKH
jgi:hypothetical protein